MRGSRRRHDAILTDQELLHTVSGTNLRNQLRDLRVVVATITADDQERALDAFGDGEEDGGDEVLGIVLLLEDLDLLAKTRAVVLSVRLSSKRSMA